MPLQQPKRGPVHFVPQLPQFELSVEVFTQEPPQIVPPEMTQNFEKPPTRVGPKVTEEVVVVVGTAVIVSVSTFEHVEALQIMPAGHLFPQMPQLLALDASS
jgi:hypothetical protein